MTTNVNILFVILSLIGGSLAGIIYFGGLWITVKHVVMHEKSSGLLLLSFLIRAGIVGVIFYALVRYQWAYLAVAMVAFMAIRQLLVHKVGQPKNFPE